MRHLTLIAATVAAALLAACANDAPPPPRATQPAATTARPNVLMIVADDLGYSDIGAFGGEIETPNLDALARQGRLLTNFHASSACSPSRAMLLSGADHHLVGLGEFGELIGGLIAADKPVFAPFGASNGISAEHVPDGYEGYLNERALSMPELLRDGGYHTYMAGKWHLATKIVAPSPGHPNPFTYHEPAFPQRKGFERSFALIDGGAAHFHPPAQPTPMDAMSYVEDGRHIAPADLPGDFYSSKDFTDKLIQYIDANKGDGKPFFAYAAYTAPHWPLQAPQADIAAQAGRYDAGYEVIRARRVQRMKALGLIPQDFVVNPGLPSVAEGGHGKKRWHELTADEKARQARLMEVYAAMVHNLDANIGRLLRHLKEIGAYDNTMIVFMSDNGADGTHFLPTDGHWDNSLANIGRPGSMAEYGERWAEVSSTPFRLSKVFTGAEGSTSVPVIVKMPDEKTPRPTLTAMTHITDVLPTVLDLTGIARPGSSYKGRAVHPMTGTSLLGALNATQAVASVYPPDTVIADELFMSSYVQRNQWKLSRVFPAGRPPTPLAQVPWQLFDVASDRGETVDLAASHPAVVKDLLGQWDRYVRDNGVRMMNVTFPILRDPAQP